MTSRIRVSFSTRTLKLATAGALVNVGVLALLCAASASSSAAPVSAPCAPLSDAQHATLEAAANGVDALREHLWTRRGVRGYDMAGTAKWIDAYRLQAAACSASVAQAAPAAPDAPAPPAADGTQVAQATR
ncbi:hypothetical protein [Scleromatobacter humisilvae]|uniref:Uncharacterized protein n=1 Tax=Scleromatobacter humisilvae TaxID=2897159 RepID=A0A9X1YF60_9BURK|nr:hypothetical protein [Scleromatobacter humisilvae]MCK9684507.1 hypothetical protein [Scleromatobacter humisilvae]